MFGNDELKNILDLLSRATADEIKELVLTGSFVIARQLDPDLTEQMLVTLQGGWRLRLTNPPSPTIVKTLFIVPTEADTKLIWEQGQRVYAIKNGIPEKHVEGWLKSQNKQKHHLCFLIAKVLDDPLLTNGILQYKESFTQQQFKLWRKSINSRLHLNARALTELAKLMIEIGFTDNEEA